MKSLVRTVTDGVLEYLNIYAADILDVSDNESGSPYYSDMVSGVYGSIATIDWPTSYNTIYISANASISVDATQVPIPIDATYYVLAASKDLRVAQTELPIFLDVLQLICWYARNIENVWRKTSHVKEIDQTTKSYISDLMSVESLRYSPLGGGESYIRGNDPDQPTAYAIMAEIDATIHVKNTFDRG